MTSEVAAMGTSRTFRKVQRNTVGGSPPLRGQRKPLVRRQATDRGARQDHEADGLLPRPELAEVSHLGSFVGTNAGIITIFRACGAFSCGPDPHPTCNV